VDFGNLPEWLKMLVSAAMGALGMFGVALIRAMTDNNRVRSDDRVQFTSQVLERVKLLEDQIAAERNYCREEIHRVQQQYESRLETRDQIITELRQRITHLEKVLQGLD